MLSSDGNTDVFFDSTDYLPLEESLVAEEVESSKLGYEIWMNEPQSIKKRRERFLQEVGLVEFASPRTCAPDSEIEPSDSSGRMEFERLTQCSEAVSSSGYAPSCNVEDNDLKMLSAEFVDEVTSPVSVSNSIPQRCQGEANVEGFRDVDTGKKKIKTWWKSFKIKAARLRSTDVSEESKMNPAESKSCRMKVYQNNKRCSEFSALYMRQKICAHKGLIWTMKFSPDGKYLASGGEDGVVRIWRVTSANASSEFLANCGNYNNKPREGKSGFSSKPLRFATVVIPEKVFQIDESPVQEFHGHSSDVLDIAWSNSNCLLSSSKDKTVRLWQVDSDRCLSVFHHKNYVTCIQFNPMDENYFISGSVDGKLRVWSVSKQRVVDWADVRDVITALSYRPDGKGFAVGSITGTCRFYETSGDYLHPDAQINLQGRKKASEKRITGIQFCRENSRVMITSEDSKVRIFEGTEIVNKYKGLSKSGSQMSASFTKNGKHIVSVGEDSRVYMWNYDSLRLPSTKETKSQQSCEHFFSDGVSVAIPWPGVGTEPKCFGDNQPQFSQRQDNQGAASWTRDSERFSLGNWFSADSLCRGSSTWPEERLPLWDSLVADDEHGNLQHQDYHQKKLNGQSDAHGNVPPPETWGLVIVVAGLDGTIKTFHNYGLPIRL